MIPTFIMFIFTQEITLLKGSPLYRSAVFMLWNLTGSSNVTVVQNMG
jgi:hypothetical protein